MNFPMNPHGLAGTQTSCPNCGGLSFDLFEDILDIDGAIAIIEICNACLALVNRGALKAHSTDVELARDAQVAELREVYPSDPNEVAFGATLEEEVPHFEKTLEFFLAKAGLTTVVSDMVSAEIGIGRGTLLRASGHMFRKAYGSDIDLTLFKSTELQLAVPDNVVLLETLSHLPEQVDLVLAWHTFEHIPRLHDLVFAIRSYIRPGGHLIFQVPLYRPENVVSSHYTFMNRRSVAVLAEIEQFDVIDIWTDHKRHFLASIFRKPL